MKIPPQTLKTLPIPLTWTLHLPTADAANMRNYKPGNPMMYIYAVKAAKRKAVAAGWPRTRPHPRYVLLRKSEGSTF